ncbi:hypothetical protein [Arthrobacter parietis]
MTRSSQPNRLTAGARSYDTLSEQEQVILCEEWAKRTAASSS